tara:strand:+ start:157 stop:453 length:297 start_codon:yes stop_codon:yes gene_type:complete
MIKNKKHLDKFMQKHWAGYLADWQKDQWDEDVTSSLPDDNMLTPLGTEELVYDFIGNVEENKEVKDIYPLIWDSIDWKKLTKDAIRIAKKECREKETA